MTSDAVKVARIQARAQRDHDALEAFKVTLKLVENPVVEFAGGMVLIELLKRQGILGAESIWTEVKGTAMQSALAGIIVAQQLAPALPSLASSGGDLVKSLAPALLAAV